ncbi:MAG: 50S ribosomal protein L25 [Nitrospirae bacterium]|nr:50S ribosomal protein L25 [Nitrospirota bacterium]
MEKILLKAEKRYETGKGAARTLRKQGLLPGVLYKKDSSTPIKLQRKEFVKLMSSGIAAHTLIAMELTDNKSDKTEHLSLIKDYHVDPVRNELLHVDFIEISMEKKIKITIPVVIIKEPMGIKKGGIMQQIMREIQIECLPADIPDKIEVDASALDIGHSLHVRDIALREGLKILSDPQAVTVTVSAPVVEEAAPAAAVAEAAPTEPELIKKTKAKEEEPVEEPQKPQKEQKSQKEQKEK